MAKRGPKPWEPSARDIEFVEECASQGISETKICEGLGHDWKTFHRNLPKFADALKKGKEEFDKQIVRAVPQVVNSLLRRCLGYEYEEIQTKQDGKIVNGQMVNGDVTITKTKKHYQPSDAAIFFFLCNKDTWINPMRIDSDTTDNKGDILKWIELLKKEPTKKIKNELG
jgi:hypothetical protein